MDTKDMVALMRNRTVPHVDDERIAARLLALEAVAVAAGLLQDGEPVDPDPAKVRREPAWKAIAVMPSRLDELDAALKALSATGWTGGRGRSDGV